MLIRANIQTQYLKDTYVFPLRDPESKIQWLLDQVLERYSAWHKFTVYEFQITQPSCPEELNTEEANILETFNIENFQTQREFVFYLKESPKSIEKRKEQARLLQEELKRKEREKKRREALRQQRITELRGVGKCWELEGYSNVLDVPLEREGKVVYNKGSLDQWACIRYSHPIPASYEVFYYSVLIEKLPPTTNTWAVCVGAVPMQFKPHHDRHWVGAQHSWAYIAGTGGKCNNSGRSVSYGDPYCEGDIIGVLINFKEKTMEFFKNGTSQGVAFKNIDSSVYPAVSVTAKGCEIRLVEDPVPAPYQSIMMRNDEKEAAKRRRWVEVTSKECQLMQQQAWEKDQKNSWSASFSYAKDEALFYPSDPDVCIVTNEGSGDKWRVCRCVGEYSKGVQAFQIAITADTPSSNTWRICIGVVPVNFVSTSDRIWIGSQGSFGYIAGTGGKCHNSGQSTSYGEAYTSGDIVTVLMDFENHTLEFFKNDESQGIAYDSIPSAVYGAVSLTATDAVIRYQSVPPQEARRLQMMAAENRKKLLAITEAYGNIWNVKRRSPDITLGANLLIATNTSSERIWNTVVAAVPYTSGRRYVEFRINHVNQAAPSTHKVCVGIVSKHFTLKKRDQNNKEKDKEEGGPIHFSEHGWGYLSDNGYKCHHSQRPVKYGQSFTTGDVIGALMDFDNRTVEFFKNGVSQELAFQDITSPLFAAVSLYGAETKVSIDGSIENSKFEELFLYR